LASASKEPACASTRHTLVIAVITCSFARWAFDPIFLTDCALVYSRASMRARHASALPIGESDVMAGRSTACTNCDWFRALHAVGYTSTFLASQIYSRANTVVVLFCGKYRFEPKIGLPSLNNRDNGFVRCHLLENLASGPLRKYEVGTLAVLDDHFNSFFHCCGRAETL
jgi:hypothetical protein